VVEWWKAKSNARQATFLLVTAPWACFRSRYQPWTIQCKRDHRVTETTCEVTECNGRLRCDLPRRFWSWVIAAGIPATLSRSGVDVSSKKAPGHAGRFSFRYGRIFSLSLATIFHLPGTFFTFCGTQQQLSGDRYCENWSAEFVGLFH
jgi:hypothetical protein